jgi:hypothetical protein
MNIAFSIKEDILLTLDSTFDVQDPPTCLSPAISQFLSASCRLTLDEVHGAWALLKAIIWQGVVPSCAGTAGAFEHLGKQSGVGPYFKLLRCH